MNLPTPTLEHVCELTVELDAILQMGPGRAGNRRIIPIVGGTVSGPLLSGKVLNIGADWQTIFNDGVAELDTRYAMETDVGATIEIINYGFRHGPPDVIDAIARGESVAPDSYYMRTQARLETGDEKYGWVNRILFVGVGTREHSTVRLKLFAIR